MQSIVSMNLCQVGDTVPFLIVPTPRKYLILYQNKGCGKEYTISNPIELNNEILTAYAFGRGIRSFILKRIVSIKPL